jgi:hypothetical protein
MTIVIEEAAPAVDRALAARIAAAAEAGLPLTALRLAEGAGLAELSVDHALSGLRLGGHAVGGIRKLGKERRIRREKRRAAARAAARHEEETRAARAAERQAELEHEMKLAAIRNGGAAPGAPRVG